MILDLPALLPLTAACAPAVAPQTLLSVARVESGFDAYAIGVNGPKPYSIRPANRAAAVATARALIAAGRNVDLGLGQINVRNLARLGLDAETVFDPCRNLAAAAKLLQDGYFRAAPRPGQEQAGLREALSRYNTGRPDLGLRNGYVAKIVAAAATLVPAIEPTADAGAGATTPPQRPAWSVFGAPASASFVLSPNSGDHP